jgi:hypothetical protein
MTKIGEKWLPVERYPGGFKSSADRHVPRYTASVDAALTLVPEGWKVSMLQEDAAEEEQWFCRLGQRRGRFGAPGTDGHAPALALCIASLIAHEKGNGSGR